MSLSPAFRQRILERQENRRRFQRVRVNLAGRFMLEDRHEYPCETIDMSPGSIALRTPVTGRMGERVVAYIDQIGRLEGTIVRNFDGHGFAMEIQATARKRDKLAAKLTWLANRQELDLPEDRRHDRTTPSQPDALVVLQDGREFRVPIIDLSLSGAALAMNTRLPIDSNLMVGKLHARVVRHLENGIGIEFVTVQTEDSVEQAFD